MTGIHFDSAIFAVIRGYNQSKIRSPMRLLFNVRMITTPVQLCEGVLVCTEICCSHFDHTRIFR